LRPVRKSNTPTHFLLYPLLAKIDLTLAYPPCLAPPHSIKQALNPCLFVWHLKIDLPLALLVSFVRLLGT